MELNYFKSLFLGLIQGITEFLPVSSSGHIVIAKNLFYIKSPGLIYEVILHFGTFLSVLVVFRTEIISIIRASFFGIIYIIKKGKLNSDIVKNYNFRLGIFIVIATIPAGFIGILLKDILSKFFESIFFVSLALIFTGIILFFTKYFKERGYGINFFNSLLIGCAQALALIPGISRSGMTISMGLFLGVKRDDAVKFSFLLSLPAIFGATILESFNIFYYHLSNEELIQIGLAFLSAFFSGYFAIKILMKIVITGRFFLFSFYCFLIGILGIILSF